MNDAPKKLPHEAFQAAIIGVSEELSEEALRRYSKPALKKFGIVWVKNLTKDPEKKSLTAFQAAIKGLTKNFRNNSTALSQAFVKPGVRTFLSQSSMAFIQPIPDSQPSKRLRRFPSLKIKSHAMRASEARAPHYDGYRQARDRKQGSQ